MLAAEYRPRAAYDVESIVTYIGQVLHSPQAARTWYENLKNAVSTLCENPDLGRAFEDDRLSLQGRRTFLVGQYRLFYSHDTEMLTIWRVIHTSQDIDDYAIVDLVDQA